MPNIQEGTCCCCFLHPVNQDGYIRVKQNINPRYQFFQLKTVMGSIMFVPIIIHITTKHGTKNKELWIWTLFDKQENAICSWLSGTHVGKSHCKCCEKVKLNLISGQQKLLYGHYYVSVCKGKVRILKTWLQKYRWERPGWYVISKWLTVPMFTLLQFYKKKSRSPNLIWW